MRLAQIDTLLGLLGRAGRRPRAAHCPAALGRLFEGMLPTGAKPTASGSPGR